MAAARKFYAALIFPKIQFLLHFGLRKMLSFLRKMLSFCAKCCLFAQNVVFLKTGPSENLKKVVQPR